MEIKEALKAACSALEDKKGEDIKVLDISGVSIISDYFLIVTGNNQNHIKTLSEAVEERLGEMGITLKHKEGYRSAAWILLDFGSVVVHVFEKEERAFYNLEHIWADAKVVDV